MFADSEMCDVVIPDMNRYPSEIKDVVYIRSMQETPFLCT
jgi:hypothetical protein